MGYSYETKWKPTFLKMTAFFFKRGTNLEITKIRCYLEEYCNEKGIPSVRLRDKATGKKVVIGGRNVRVSAFLRFLSQAKIHQDIMPTIFDRNGTDIVAVTGNIISVTEDEIRVNVEMGGYLYE